MGQDGDAITPQRLKATLRSPHRGIQYTFMFFAPHSQSVHPGTQCNPITAIVVTALFYIHLSRYGIRVCGKYQFLRAKTEQYAYNQPQQFYAKQQPVSAHKIPHFLFSYQSIAYPLSHVP